MQRLQRRAEFDREVDPKEEENLVPVALAEGEGELPKAEMNRKLSKELRKFQLIKEKKLICHRLSKFLLREVELNKSICRI